LLLTLQRPHRTPSPEPAHGGIHDLLGIVVDVSVLVLLLLRVGQQVSVELGERIDLTIG
jgi:hypothetical protein